MYPALHRILVILYAALPVAALAWAVRRAVVTGRKDCIVAFLLTAFSGVILGSSLILIYSFLLHGAVRASKVFATWYLMMGVLLVLRLLRWGARESVFRLFRVARDDRGRPANASGARASLAFLCYVLFVVAAGLPFVIGAMFANRVPVRSAQTPMTIAECAYESVAFPAADGSRVSGWWIPADPVRRDAVRRRGNDWGRNTVLMCGGIGDRFTQQPGLLRVLVNDGYNVLAFDLRGQGDSGGQWTSFGDLERNDVLGALRWAKANYPDGAVKVFGLGFGIGGAATIAAAASPGGESIDAVAVYGTYANLNHFVRAVVDERLAQPMRWIAMNVALPVASAHAGSDLSAFSPAKLAPSLWPRPLLVIHGRGDTVVPFSEGEDLFRAASYPRQSLWLSTDHLGAFRNRYGARVLLEFFDTARSVPAI